MSEDSRLLLKQNKQFVSLSLLVFRFLEAPPHGMARDCCVPPLLRKVSRCPSSNFCQLIQHLYKSRCCFHSSLCLSMWALLGISLFKTTSPDQLPLPVGDKWDIMHWLGNRASFRLNRQWSLLSWVASLSLWWEAWMVGGIQELASWEEDEAAALQSRMIWFWSEL